MHIGMVGIISLSLFVACGTVPENSINTEIASPKKLNQGDQAPNFEALNDQNEMVSLNDFKGQKVIIYFYPKDDTPGCTTQACSFRDNYVEVQEKNAVVLGVSPDGAESHQKFRTKYKLPFQLLVDTEHVVAEQFGVWVEKIRDGKTKMGISRSHFVIDEDGVIIDAQYDVEADLSAKKALAQLN
jgi:peroxiredoxin Q/BCP